MTLHGHRREAAVADGRRVQTSYADTKVEPPDNAGDTLV